MITSEIKLEEFNNCPGAEAVKHYLYTHNMLPYIKVVDFNPSHLSVYVNSGDTLVLAILKGKTKVKTEVQAALALGQMAARFSVDEFYWCFIDGTYIVRLWWD